MRSSNSRDSDSRSRFAVGAVVGGADDVRDGVVGAEGGGERVLVVVDPGRDGLTALDVVDPYDARLVGDRGWSAGSRHRPRARRSHPGEWSACRAGAPSARRSREPAVRTRTEAATSRYSASGTSTGSKSGSCQDQVSPSSLVVEPGLVDRDRPGPLLDRDAGELVTRDRVVDDEARVGARLHPRHPAALPRAHQRAPRRR